MGGESNQFEVRRIRAGTLDHQRAMRDILGLHKPPGRPAQASPATGPGTSVSRPAAPVDLLIGGYRRDELVSACLAIESPGAAALVFVPAHLETDGQYRANVLVLKALQTIAWERSISLLEVLVPPGSDSTRRALDEAGFRYLTRLQYLKRQETRRRIPHGVRNEEREGAAESRSPRLVTRVSLPSRALNAATDLEWVSYTPDLEPLFQEAVERTYVQSLDCPELTDLRSTANVLAGHRATGIFDPALWRVARRREEPVGVMLLNRIPSETALEVVYMGVAQVARGTGVADALLQWAVQTAAHVSLTTLALAVDERNTPALRLYRRWGFVDTGVRDAWIASSPPT